MQSSSKNAPPVETNFPHMHEFLCIKRETAEKDYVILHEATRCIK